MTEAIYLEILDRASTDAAFRAQLLDRPSETLAEAGYPAPTGATWKVVQNTPDTMYVVLPERPGKLTLDDLDMVAGGADSDNQLSPNVVKVFKEINEKGALQFDVPNWAAQNMPLSSPGPGFFWYPAMAAPYPYCR